MHGFGLLLCIHAQACKFWKPPLPAQVININPVFSTHTRTHARTHARTHTHAHTHAHTHSYEERLLSSDPSAPPLSLKECEEMMTRLKENYPEEYIIYDLSSVAVAMVFPLVKSCVQVSSRVYWDVMCIFSSWVLHRAGTCLTLLTSMWMSLQSGEIC